MAQHSGPQKANLLREGGDLLCVAGDQPVGDFGKMLNFPICALLSFGEGGDLPIRAILPFGDLLQDALHAVKAVFVLIGQSGFPLLNWHIDNYCGEGQPPCQAQP